MDSPFSYSRGELPADWNKRRLGSLLQFRNGQDVPGTDNESKSYPVYGSGGEFKRTNKYLFDGTSILFGRKGTIDKPLLVNGRFWTVDTMYFTVPRPDVDPRFVYYWALDAPLSILSTNTAVPSMTSSDLAQLYLAVPPLDTQCAIADYLDRETAEIDGMRADLDEMERLLEERRRNIVKVSSLNCGNLGATTRN
ncbi:restriction endonuclease subunit S [Corynebacterium sp. KPL2680]|uniref:restriction endonuclease subunit S n=1 Tax=Corynebacterium sp. KPL2680 TaxID=3158310 RepID=UPI0032EDB654